jgi:hypothetical protein
MSNTQKGRLSYAPAEVVCFYGGSASPAMKSMYPLLHQQIAVLCRQERESVDDMAAELGIDRAYLTEELETMADSGILKKETGGIFLTDFCMFPLYEWTKARYGAYLACITNTVPKKVTDILDCKKDKILALDFYGNTFDYDYLRWFLYVIASYKMSEHALAYYEKKNERSCPKDRERPWHVTAKFKFPDDTRSNDNCRFDKMLQNWSTYYQNFSTADNGLVEFANVFDVFPFPHVKQFTGGPTMEKESRAHWLDGTSISLLIALVKNPQKVLTETEEKTVSQFIKFGILTKDAEGFHSAIPVFPVDAFEALEKIISDAVKPLSEEYADLVSSRVEKLLLPFVRRDLMYNFITWDMRVFFQPINELLWYGMNDGKSLVLPGDYSRSCAGLYIVTGKKKETIC